MATPVKEFHVCVLGNGSVGKTSYLLRLNGVPFQRKTGHKASLEEEATKYSIEIATSAGLLLFHFIDWAWSEKKRDQSINQELMKGSDGAIFMYDVTEKRSKSDFCDYLDWYSRACGFDKPWSILSNKNDQKKKTVQEGEGQALARAGDKRGYIAISLVDDTGIDDSISMLAKIMLQDLNLSVSSFGPASPSSLQWAADRAATRIAGIGLGIDGAKAKTQRILLLSLNSSVNEKFTEAFATSEFEIIACGSIDVCEEEFTTTTDTSSSNTEQSSHLPIVAVLIPPTASENQKKAVNEFALKHSIKCIVSVPRNAVEETQKVIA